MLGATYLGNGRCEFVVWAPFAAEVKVRLLHTEEEFLFPLTSASCGYHQATVEGVLPGDRYWLLLTNRTTGQVTARPDPASRFQRDGVHGASSIVDPEFAWSDEGWTGIDLASYIFYELHVGTFTPEGTLDAIIPHLPALNELGVTAIELMPLAQFPGPRNWGYDGVFPYAVQDSYGGPLALKRLVDACHRQGLAVTLDVVYNHLGPEGNYFGDFGPYFTTRYQTPWGQAMNFDGPHSDKVRRFFIENALSWIADFHIDALRVDAVHAIFDASAQPFLAELNEAVRERAVLLKRRVHTIAESNLNDVRVIRCPEQAGLAFDAQWSDDLHHSLHALLTGERDGYYQDFGQLHHLAKAYAEGFVYSGQYSAYRRRPHGNSSCEEPSVRFVVAAQNHDQIGNRMMGERLGTLVDLDAARLAAVVVLLSPFLPLLFMGEEYGETAPFLYFTSHSGAALIEAVRQGRRKEFASFAWQAEPADPQAESTFAASKVNRHLRDDERGRGLFDFYWQLIHLRKTAPALAPGGEPPEVIPFEHRQVLLVIRRNQTHQCLLVFHFAQTSIAANLPIPEGRWTKLLDSAGTLPNTLVSIGDELTLTLSGRSTAIFQRSVIGSGDAPEELTYSAAFTLDRLPGSEP